MIKQCVVCGKDFEAKNSKYVCCSCKCREKRQALKAKQWREKNKEHSKEWKREYRKKNRKIIICKLCGKPVQQENLSGKTHWHYCTECALKDILETVKSGGKITMLQYNRLYVRGYCTADIKNYINEHIEKREVV